MAKDLQKPITRSTLAREDKKLRRVFVDLSGKMPVPNVEGKWYTLFVRDDFTRFIRVYLLGKKSDAASAFESLLARVRADGTPSTVMAVRSDNGGEFFGGDFGKLCRKRNIKQKFTPADSPKYNGVAERALALIHDEALAARIQALVLYPGAPAYPSLWAEVVSWAFHVLNHIATTANSGTSPHTRYGAVCLPPPRRCGRSSSQPSAEQKDTISRSRKHKTTTTEDPALTTPVIACECSPPIAPY